MSANPKPEPTSSESEVSITKNSPVFGSESTTAVVSSTDGEGNTSSTSSTVEGRSETSATKAVEQASEAHSGS